MSLRFRQKKKSTRAMLLKRALTILIQLQHTFQTLVQTGVKKTMTMMMMTILQRRKDLMRSKMKTQRIWSRSTMINLKLITRKEFLDQPTH